MGSLYMLLNKGKCFDFNRNCDGEAEMLLLSLLYAYCTAF